MRKLLLPLILCIALNSTANESIIRQLLDVNAEWKHQSDGLQLANNFEAQKNKSFDDWIATHLMLVEQTLRQRPTQNLTSEQASNRFMLLDELNAYWHSRAFPVNDYLSYKNPIFIDRTGNHCAVGFLMKQSGASALANEINSKQKFAFIKEITVDGVAEWAHNNGFTIDELAWIQPGYPVNFAVEDLEGGLNGTVNCMITSPLNPAIYAGGSFTSSTKGVSCSGIAMYMSGFAGWDWIGLNGGGVTGTVNTLIVHNDALYVGGNFTMAGTVPVNNIAIYDLQTDQWMAMGSLDNEVTCLTVYNNEIYAGGKFTGFLSKWNGTQWQDVTQGFIYGEGARTLEVWDNTLLIGGNFELATGALRRNVATYDGTYMGASGFGTTTPVNDFEVFRDTLYAACDFVHGTDSCAIARLVNSDWEITMKPFSLIMDYLGGTSIKQMMAADNQLFCAGTFTVASGMAYGSNLMKFDNDITTGLPICIPLLITDSGINTIAALNNTICFGGTFITAGGDTLNNVGQFSNSLLGIENPNNTSDLFEVYPNPANDYFTIRMKEYSANNNLHVKIYDLTGREVMRKKIYDPLISVEMPTAKGSYIVRVVDGDMILGVKRVVMN